MLFDLLYLDGHSTVDLPYRERRSRLDGLGLSGPHWQTPAYHVGDGKALREAARANGLPGVVAKRLDSPYTPEAQTRDWIYVNAT
jgi:bifunctional non-homologous end joining protein LigD